MLLKTPEACLVAGDACEKLADATKANQAANGELADVGRLLIPNSAAAKQAMLGRLPRHESIFDGALDDAASALLARASRAAARIAVG